MVEWSFVFSQIQDFNPKILGNRMGMIDICVFLTAEINDKNPSDAQLPLDVQLPLHAVVRGGAIFLHESTRSTFCSRNDHAQSIARAPHDRTPRSILISLLDIYVKTQLLQAR